VFTDESGAPAAGECVEDVHPVRGAGGMPSMTFHGVRHEHASPLLEGGVPLGLSSASPEGFEPNLHTFD
jgi:hypothetical protein